MPSIDDDFFDVYTRWRAPLMTVRTERTPEEMLVPGGVERDDWIEWRLLPGDDAAASALADLERTSGLRLPPSFRRWYTSRYTLDMDVSFVRLPENPSNDPCGPLRRLLTEPYGFGARVRQLGLVPFGDEAQGDAGPLCFDARQGLDPDAWPITYWDHEWAGTENEIGPTLFSSFDRLLVACTAGLRRSAELRHVVPVRPLMDRQAECRRALVEADPDGAGGPGAEYWGVRRI